MTKCALQGCTTQFDPVQPHQKYCKPAHRKRAAVIREHQIDSLAARMATIPNLSPGTDPQLRDPDLIAEAERRGFVIYKPTMTDPVIDFDTSRIKGDRVRLAAVSCTHFGSRFQQQTALEEFCRYAIEEANVDAFVHCGDMCDGPLEMHKGMVHEQFLHTYDSQKKYAVENIPAGKPWYAISGNHDDSFLKNAGGEIVRAICNERDDMTYLGRSQGYMRFGEVMIEVVHPHMGGSYARSYRLQKHIEAQAPERKPNIILMGNFHKVAYVDYRNVAGFMLPAFQSQSSWMASKSLESQVGGLIVEFGVTSRGLAPSVKVEWVMQREPRPNDYPHA